MAKTAAVEDLRVKLSEYLSDVKHGETILVTERGHVVAQLVPPKQSEAELSEVERVRRQLLTDGLVTRLGTQVQEDWPEPARTQATREQFEAAFDAQRGDR